MDAYNVAEAKTHFSALIERVEAGESVEIMRRGKPVARVVPIAGPKKPIDFEAIRRLRASLPPDPTNAADIVRQMRDEARY